MTNMVRMSIISESSRMFSINRLY
jgi:hypothetical protein